VPFFKYKQHIFHVNFNYATSLMKIRNLLLVLFLYVICCANWETIGGNSQRTSFLDVVRPESKYDILWEGSLYSCAGLPILIYENKLVA